MNLQKHLLLAALCTATTLSPAFSQGEVGDALAPDPTPKLSATLTTDELSGTALVGSDDIIIVDVSNNGKRPLLLDGDSAQIGGQTPLSQNMIMAPPPKNTLPEDAIEVGVSLGTAGIANVAIDHTNIKNNPGPAFYGKDDKRRKLAEARFGQRLLYPGETSQGQVYVSAQSAASGSISIPVYSHPDGARLGNIVLSLSRTAPSSATAPIDSNLAKARKTSATTDPVAPKKKRRE
ncbi:MAG: hypothetical protein K2X77_03480 [Candidatus Obscuribacterales bacterium]|jgi:hypothetical protein|nr:hypothetical protein [Candidatus Obscuribacterales bacterium]